MKILSRQGRAFFLLPVVLAFLLVALLVPLMMSPQRALAASTTPQQLSDESCVRVTYTVSSQWPGGFIGTVTITNLCTKPIFACWTLQFDFTANQQITQVWNASFSQSGSHVVITGCVEIPPGASVSIGFAGIWSGSNPPPIHLLFNGAPV